MNRLFALTVAALCLMAGALKATAANEKTLVLNWEIANSGTDTGRTGWNLRTLGWPGFIAKNVRPAVEWCKNSGVTPKVLIHHAHGQYGPDAAAMHLDGYDWAKASAAKFLLDDFATDAGWKSVTDEVDCYAYVGGADIIPRLRKLKTTSLATLIVRNLKPYADAGFRGVFIDYAENAIVVDFVGVNAGQSNRPSVDILTLAVADAMFPERSGVEAAPRSAPPFKHLWGRNIVAQDSLWRHRYGGFTPEQIARFGYGARHTNFKALSYDRSLLTGEVWRTIPYSDKTAEVVELAKLIAAEGDVAAVGPQPLIRDKVKASELFPE